MASKGEFVPMSEEKKPIDLLDAFSPENAEKTFAGLRKLAKEVRFLLRRSDGQIVELPTPPWLLEDAPEIPFMILPDTKKV